MEEKFQATLRAIVSGTKDYKIAWEYLSDSYYSDAETYYDKTYKSATTKFEMFFDSGFEATYKGLLFLIVCIDVTATERKKKKSTLSDEAYFLDNVEEMFELRIYEQDDMEGSSSRASHVDFEATLLLFNSLDENYEPELKQLYSFAAGSASGADRVMDKIINELGNGKELLD